MSDWYSKPVFFSRDVPACATYYTESLGFRQDWVHREDGETLVTQVSRASKCKLILALERSGDVSNDASDSVRASDGAEPGWARANFYPVDVR